MWCALQDRFCTKICGQIFVIVDNTFGKRIVIEEVLQKIDRQFLLRKQQSNVMLVYSSNCVVYAEKTEKLIENL